MKYNMKHTILALAIGALSLVSCEKFLDEKPQSDLTKESTEISITESAYKSVSDAQSELNGVYASFKTDIYEANNFYFGDCMTDNCYIGGDGVGEEQFGNCAVTATNSLVALMWSQYYAIVGSATNVIENTKLMDKSLIDESTRAQIIADAKFARAFVLFDIVRLWGDAPMVLQLIPSITAENLDEWYPVMYPARASADDIYKQILDDLGPATIDNLPSVNHGQFSGTKGAAYGLLAKVYATMGEKSQRDYDKVIEYCQKVENEGYKLVDNFDDLWTVSGKMSSEGIFEMYFSAEDTNWAYWVLLTEKSGEVEVTWRRYCAPTQDLIAKYDKENDVRYASSFYWAEVPYDTYWPAKNYPLAYKIRQKDNDIILMRLADILLLKAEALVEKGQTAEAMQIVNQIRTRAHVAPVSASSTDQARLAVENERQLELVLEGQRWFDLVRTGRLQAVLSKAHNKNGSLRFQEIPAWREKFPIPQEQIDINERLTQNEGY